MPTSPVRAVLEALSRDSRIRGTSSESATSFLMDLMYFGDFSILEQVSSGDVFERVNLIGHKGPATGVPLVLVSTVSTSVEPVPALWPSLEGDGLAARTSADGKKVHGLGANGGKVDAVLKILAGSRFRPEELKRPLFFIALSGEEAHGSGARSIIETLPGGEGLALVHAPTALQLWTDHPGAVSLRLELTRKIRHRRMPPHAGFFEVRVQGRSAHALAAGPAAPSAEATNHLPPAEDALARGLEVLAALRRHGEVRVLSIEAGESANRVPGRCTLRVATSYDALPPLKKLFGSSVEAQPIADGTSLPFPIEGIFQAWFDARDAGLAAIEPRLGHLRNRPAARPHRPHWTGRLVSDRDSISGSIMVWTGPGVDNADLCERFAQAVQRALIGQEEIEVQIDVVQDRPAFAASEGTEDFLDTMRASMRSAEVPYSVGGGLFTTDAALFRTHGFETLVFGPGGPLDRLYRDDESIDASRIDATALIYENLIRRHCL
ncbi:MAG: M20/M25/M40 family metallo-hydrolase [Deltaproteobacteria bacterium]|nr:M20/M25/M40 family metallo-hydrolase [Deltaproteobacteria bacterium]